MKKVLAFQKFIIGAKEILCIVGKILESKEETFFIYI